MGLCRNLVHAGTNKPLLLVTSTFGCLYVFLHHRSLNVNKCELRRRVASRGTLMGNVIRATSQTLVIIDNVTVNRGLPVNRVSSEGASPQFHEASSKTMLVSGQALSRWAA